MMIKLRSFVTRACIVAVIGVTLVGCTSSETFKPEDIPVRSEIVEQQNWDDSPKVMPQGLTDEELKAAAETYQAYLNRISDQLSEIWAGVKPENYHVIITNGNTNYYISNSNYEEIDIGQDGAIASNLQALQYAVGMYLPVTYRGENITAMNLMKMADVCTEDDLLLDFTILMHESFHLHSQSKWQGVDVMAVMENEQSNMRASAYPLDEQPRIFRAMLYDSLYRAWNAARNAEELKYLGNAKYWFEKWVDEYPEEYLFMKDSDLSEGTAEYFGNEIRRILQNEKSSPVSPEEFSLQCQSADLESYDLGDIAIQLLKRRGEFQETDFEEGGKTPVEILMENIADSIEEPENPELVRSISDSIRETNSRVSECFSDYINADAAGEMTYIGIDSESLTGIMSEGFYYLSEIGKTGWQNAFVSNSAIQIIGKNVLEYEDSILIPIIPSELTMDNEEISSIRTDGIALSASVKYKEKMDKQGNVIYQLQSE